MSEAILKNTKSAQEISKKHNKQTCNLRHKKTFRQITQNILKTNLFIKATGKTKKRFRNSSSSDSEKYLYAGSSLCNTLEDEETEPLSANKVSANNIENSENNIISSLML